MSCYEWEHGTIKLPAKEWAGFRKGLLEDWNKNQLELLERAKRAHAAIKGAVKGKRGKKREEALRAAIRRHVGDLNSVAAQPMERLVLEWDAEALRHKLKSAAPKKKDLELFAVSKDAEIHLPDACVKFVNESRSVVWDVPENNHAREHARDHWFARRLFAKLDRIKWTRGSGGKLLGNDEYNRDAGGDYEGGGGSYVTAEYGPNTPRRGRAARPTLGFAGRGW